MELMKLLIVLIYLLIVQRYSSDEPHKYWVYIPLSQHTFLFSPFSSGAPIVPVPLPTPPGLLRLLPCSWPCSSSCDPSPFECNERWNWGVAGGIFQDVTSRNGLHGWSMTLATSATQGWIRVLPCPWPWQPSNGPSPFRRYFSGCHVSKRSSRMTRDYSRWNVAK